MTSDEIPRGGCATRAEASDRIYRMFFAGRLLRRSWYKGALGDDGFEHACLLAAIAPEIGLGYAERIGLGDAERPNPGRCPARLLPQWLALLTPWIDDAGSSAAWALHVMHYADLLRQSDVLDAAAWRRLERRVHAALLEEAAHQLRAPFLLRAFCPFWITRDAIALFAAAANSAITEAEFAEAKNVLNRRAIEATAHWDTHPGAVAQLAVNAVLRSLVSDIVGTVSLVLSMKEAAMRETNKKSYTHSVLALREAAERNADSLIERILEEWRHAIEASA